MKFYIVTLNDTLREIKKEDLQKFLDYGCKVLNENQAKESGKEIIK
jgi:hypothetical protein